MDQQINQTPPKTSTNPDESVSQPPSVTSVQTPPEPKLKSKLLIPFFVIFFIFLAGVGAYAYYKYFSPTCVSNGIVYNIGDGFEDGCNSCTCTREGAECTLIACTEQKPPAVDIDTSDWQTYRNEEYGFEFKYPSNYRINQDNPLTIVESDITEPLVFKANLIRDVYQQLSQTPNINIELAESGRTLDAIVIQVNSDFDKRVQESSSSNLYPNATPPQTITQENLTINDVSIVKITRDRGPGGPYPMQDYYYMKLNDGLLLAITVNYGEDAHEIGEDGSDERDTAYQVLSTFEFVGEEDNSSNASNNITGSIMLFRGNLDSSIFKLSASSTNGEIIDVKIWTDVDEASEWEPYGELKAIPFGEEIYSEVFVQFRDSQGNISDTYSEYTSPKYSPADPIE